MKEERFADGELGRGGVGPNLFELADVGCLLRFRGHERPEFFDPVALDVKHAGPFWRVQPFVQTGAEVIAPQIALFERELGKRMSAVDDGLNAAGARHVADCFHRRDLAGDIDLMGNKDEPGAVSDSFFKRSADFVEILRRDRNFNEIELEVFAFLPLPQGGEHARVILSGGENFVARLEVHAHEQSLERLGRVAGDRDFFPIATEHFGQAGANGLALRLEDLPHGVGSGVFLFPDVTHERFGDDARAGRHAAVIQVDDPARDAERFLDGSPVIFVGGRFFRVEMRDGVGRGLDVFQ